MKVKKTFGSWQQPEIQAIIELAKTQSKITLANWCLDYAENEMLPIFMKYCHGDERPKQAVQAAKDWLDGKIKLPQAKQYILACHKSAVENEGNPAAQASARAIGQAASVIHSARHALGIAFYGAAAKAYSKAGLTAGKDVYDETAKKEFTKLYGLLKSIAVENEQNPAKTKWHFK